jgi:hypothetical protein
MKFLIDECLSPELAQLARARGHGESSHVVWLNRAGWKDWNLKPFIVDGDWTFVTSNAIDFRRPADRPGSRGQYADVSLHAGLVCLGGLAGGITLDDQIALFEIALGEIAEGDLVNQVLARGHDGRRRSRSRAALQAAAELNAHRGAFGALRGRKKTVRKTQHGISRLDRRGHGAGGSRGGACAGRRAILRGGRDGQSPGHFSSR